MAGRIEDVELPREWPAEVTEYQDYSSGVRVRKLTNHKCHSWHLYFHNPGWWDEERRLLFKSHRGNRNGTYSLELATGAITYIAPVLVDIVNPQRPEGYASRGHQIVAVDLNTGAIRPLYDKPEGFNAGQIQVTADGNHISITLNEQVDVGPVETMKDYVGFAERWAARPLSKILLQPVDGGDAELVFEEQSWIGHVQPSPTQNHLISFCHEGPWDKVDQRMWMLDRTDGRVWPVRPESEGEAIGHEYWLADGESLGYHGRVPDGEGGKRSVFGFIRYDNTSHIEPPFPGHSTHFHSNVRALVVGDGDRAKVPYVLLWKFNGESFEGPRVLCRHGSSFQVQITHVHPRFSPDGQQVVFTTDVGGYGNVYLADVPEFDTLPRLEDV